jgi:arsenate reductase
MKRVLFVCVENARRSQIAEALLKKLAEGRIVAVSAGDSPASKVDPKAIKVMEEIGVDLTNQRPKPLTLKMVEEADVVITMGCGTEVCPVIPKQVEEWKIEDPAGKPIAKFREARNEIQKRVEKLIKRLEEADR